MKWSMGLLLGLLFQIGIISSAEAIKIKQAEIDGGAVVVAGNQAAKRSPIEWEGVQVTASNNGGAFRFTTSILPADCVGELSDGVSTIEVVIEDCTPTLNTAPAPVPQTGQVLCYDTPGAIINCSGTGQDGAMQKGVKIPTPRFTDNTDGTITDNLTGLIWLKNANCPPTGIINWATALTYVASLNSDGTMNGNDCGDTSNGGSHQTDWRLPNIRELFSLVDFAFHGPALSNAAGTGQATTSDPFTNFAAAVAHWSSTSFEGASISAWAVLFSEGRVESIHKISNGLVLAVRGGS